MFEEKCFPKIYSYLMSLRYNPTTEQNETSSPCIIQKGEMLNFREIKETENLNKNAEAYQLFSIGANT